MGVFALLVNFLNFKVVSDEDTRETGFSFLVQIEQRKVSELIAFTISFSVQLTHTAVDNTNFTVLLLLPYGL